MDVGWKRLHLLLFFLTFWKHAVGRESLGFQNVYPRSLRFLKTYSPPEVQSSMLNASVTRNIPHEEVDSNVLRGNGTGPSTSLFSYLQFIKEGAPSGYASLSQAQSASSSSVSTSLTAPQNPSQPGSFSTLFQVQGSSASNVMAGQSVSGIGYNQYDSTSKESTGLNTGGSIQLVSSTGGGGLSQSSFSQYAPGSSPLSYSPTVLSQSGSKTLNTSSQSSSGTLMGGLSSRLFTLTSQGSSRPPVTQGGSTSFSGLFQQSPSKSQSSPTYSHPGSLPLAGSRYPTSSQSLFSSGSQGSSSYQLGASRPSGLAQGSSSQPGVSYVQSQGRLSQLAIGSPQYGSVSLASPQVPQKWLPSASSFSPGSQTSGTVVSQSSYSPQSAPAPSKPLSSVGRPSQVAPSLLSSESIASSQNVLFQYDKAAVKTPSSFSPSSAGGPLVSTQGVGSYSGSSYVPGSSTYSKVVSSPLGAPSQFTSAQSSRDPSTLSLQGGVGTVQTVSSHYVLPQKGTLSTFSSSLQSQVASRPYGPAPSLDAKVPIYSQTHPAGTMYQSQPSRFWQPSTSKASGSFSTSDATVLQSSSSSQSVQASSRFSSAGGASYPVSTQGGGSYSGVSLYPGTVPQYTPVAPASGVFGSSPLSVSSQSASGQSSPSKHSSLSQSQTGSRLTSSGYLSVPGGSGSSDGSSLLTQGTLGKYAPVPSMDTPLPASSQTKAVSSGVSLSQSQPLQSWQPSATGWHQVIQASGSAPLQSGSSQSAQTSGTISFQPASSVPVDSVAQSGQTPVSWQTSSLLGFGSRPSRLLSIASSGSVSNQMSPGLSASLKLPTSSMTPGSTAQSVSVSSQAQPLTDLVKYGASVGGQGVSSGLSSVLYSRYGSSSQSGPVSSSPVSGSAGSQVSPSVFASLKLPTGSMTPGLTAPGVSVSSQAQPLTDPVKYDATVGGQGVSSGLSVLYSRYGSSSQSGPVSGSAGSQVSPSVFASLKLPTGSMIPGLTAPGVSVSSQAQPLTDPVKYDATVGGQGLSSGLSSVLYSRYGSSSQSGQVSSSPVSGSAGSQVSPSVFASLKLPTGSITRGSTSQTASGGMSSAPPQALGDTYGASVGGQGMSSGSVSSGFTSVSSNYGSFYGQNDPLSKPSQVSFSQYNAVKG